jgi:uncharacterized membrane protein
MNRIIRHLLTARWLLQRQFPPATLAAIEAAIRASETRHSGEIRFAIETCLDARQLWSGTSARERAEWAFAHLRVWDTAANNGVLIYLLLADRDIEIVADRGIAALVDPTEWQQVCAQMEREFGGGRFEAGALAGIATVTTLLSRHFPPQPGDRNELPNQAVLL